MSGPQRDPKAEPARDAASPLPLDEAKRRIDAAIAPLAVTERVALVDALGRVVARDVVSRVRVPGYDNSAMDGYALRGDARAPRTLRIVGAALAGHPFRGTVDDDACVRIMTGAPMPADCDAVVPFEDATLDGDRVVVPRIVAAGANRRRAGESFSPGDVVVASGRIATPADLGALAAVGCADVDVVRRVRVAVFSTGDELRAFDAPLDDGCIRDQNRYTLIGMLTRLGVDAIDLGIVADDPDALDAVVARACGDDVRADAVVTSGGVSSGDADRTRDVMRRRGDVAFWSLAIKPGRPMAFGRIGPADRPAWLFALPGNPVAVMVVFYAIVRDALLKLMGARAEPLPALSAIADEPIAKVRGRSEFVRGVVYRGADEWRVRPTGSQSSAVLRSMSEANGLVVLAHDRGPVAAGDVVEVLPFLGLV